MKKPPCKPRSRSPKEKPFRLETQRVLEKDIQSLVLSWLWAMGYYAKRIPVGAYPFRRRDGSIAFGKNPLKGFPDILVVLKGKKRRGHLCVIELKSDNGRLSEDQKIELKSLHDAGVLVIVARDLATVVETLRREDV